MEKARYRRVRENLRSALNAEAGAHQKFIEEVKVHLGIKAIGRKIREQGGTLLGHVKREHLRCL